MKNLSLRIISLSVLISIARLFLYAPLGAGGRPAASKIITRQSSTPNILAAKKPSINTVKTISRSLSSKSLRDTKNHALQDLSAPIDNFAAIQVTSKSPDKPSREVRSSTELDALAGPLVSKYNLNALEPALKQELVTKLQAIQSENPESAVAHYRKHLRRVKRDIDPFKSSRAASKLALGLVNPDTAKAFLIKKATKNAVISDLGTKEQLSAAASQEYEQALSQPAVTAMANTLSGASGDEVRKIATEKAIQAARAQKAAEQSLKEYTEITAAGDKKKELASQAHADAVATIGMKKSTFDKAQTDLDLAQEALGQHGARLQQINNELTKNIQICTDTGNSWSGMFPGTPAYNKYYEAEAAIKGLTATKSQLEGEREKFLANIAVATAKLDAAKKEHLTSQQTAAEKERIAAATKTEADKAIEAATIHKNTTHSAFENAQSTSQATNVVAEAITRKEAAKQAQQRAEALHLKLPTDLNTLTAGVKISGNTEATDVIEKLSPSIKDALIERLQSVHKTFKKRPEDMIRMYKKHLQKMSAADPSYVDGWYKKNSALAKIQTVDNLSPEEIAIKAKESFIKKFIKSELNTDAQLKKERSLQAHLKTDYSPTNNTTPAKNAELIKIKHDAEATLAKVNNARKAKAEAAWDIENAARQKEQKEAAAARRAAEEAAHAARLETIPGKIEAKLHTVKEKASNALINAIKRVKEPARPKQPKGYLAPKTWGEILEGLKNLHDRPEKSKAR